MKQADLTNHTRKTASFMYANFILQNPSDEDVITVNQNIMNRWSKSGLIFIKEKAWRILKAAGYNVGF